jgi:DNA-binding protein Fis
MERVALLSDRDEVTGAMLDFLTPDDAAEPAEAADVADAGSLEGALRARIEAALRASGGNIRRTAAALGISRNTLRARMDKYGLRHHDVMRSRTPDPCPPSTVTPSDLPSGSRHLSFLRVNLRVANGGAPRAGDDRRRSNFGGRIENEPPGVIAAFGLEPVDNAPSHAASRLAIQNAAPAHTPPKGPGVWSAPFTAPTTSSPITTRRL